jgi:type IV secretion system protein VirB10
VVHRWAILSILTVGSIQCALGQAPAAPVPAASGVPTASAVAAGVKTYTVPAGTRILLSLKSEISSRIAMPGDPVYLVSDFPVVADGIAVLPAGMYVRGVIDTVQRPGRVKGRAQLQLHFTSIILPNGVQVALPGSLDSAPGSSGAKVKNGEGTVEEAGSKRQDAQRIAQTATVGAGVGSLAGVGSGDGVKGLGIGAGAGAAVGVLTTLLTRGNDIVFQPGTNLEMVLNRPLVLEENQLAGMSAYTGLVGGATGPKPTH